MKSAAILLCLVFALSKAVAQDAVAPTNHIEFFKVITDAQTGEYAAVNPDKTIVSLKDKNGDVIWATNVVMAIKSYPKAIPLPNIVKINSMQFSSNLLTVVVTGEVAVKLGKQTGQTKIIVQN